MFPQKSAVFSMILETISVLSVTCYATVSHPPLRSLPSLAIFPGFHFKPSNQWWASSHFQAKMINASGRIHLKTRKDGKTNDMDTLTKQRTCVDSLFLFDWLLDLNGFWDIHCRDLDCPLFIASSFMMYHQEGMGTYDCQPSLILLHDHQT